ncbi:MAG: hypothetical protein IJ928_07950 [Prevotella sp.]|nr:hypothetical protein [Prevotella sp.]
MKDNDKEVNIDELAFSVDVDGEVIEKVRTGDITHIGLQINEDNQRLVLENIDGHLILITDEMPTTYHSCYYYNGGVFPYAIKKSLSFLVLSDGEESCLTRIIGVTKEPGIRFNYQGLGKPVVENPQGDSCVWHLYFEVIPVPKEPKTYLMRWNPAISSYTEKDYEECVANMKNGMFRLNWSIYEWEEARKGDLFYMMRVGDDKAGIVFNGQFISDPYPADDWAGTTRRRMYVDMVCSNPSEPRSLPCIPLEKLQEAIPSIAWSKGHSGALLPEDVVTKLKELF